ncbi:MAG: cytochrome c biogenesis protein CcdA [Candidatus Binatia bacterium]
MSSRARLRVGEQATVAVRVEIAAGWHLSGDDRGADSLVPVSLDFELPRGVSVANVAYPVAGEREVYFGGGRRLSVYEDDLTIDAVLSYDQVAGRHREAVALLRYQACTDTFCLRPELLRLPLDIDFSCLEGLAYAGFGRGPLAVLGLGGIWIILPGLLLMGLVLNLRPCLGPLILVTLANFGRWSRRGAAARVGLAVSYTGGIAATFSVFAVAAAFAAEVVHGDTATWLAPLALGAGAFVVLLSMFGLYRVCSTQPVEDQGFGASSLGMIMGLVAAPCIGPLVAALVRLGGGSKVDLVLSLAVILTLCLGLGVSVIGFARGERVDSGRLLASPWLRWAEHGFGCLLLAMACYLIAPALPAAIAGSLLPGFLAVAVVYLAFVDGAAPAVRRQRMVRRAIGAGALLMLAGAYLPLGYSAEALSWTPFSAAAYDEARSVGKPFAMEFSAEWCMPCKEMAERTFTDSSVIQAAGDMEFLSVDITVIDRKTELIMEAFDVFSAPTTIFFGKDGKELTRRLGFIGPVDFAGLLRRSWGKAEDKS